jgi:hypothetical protein
VAVHWHWDLNSNYWPVGWGLKYSYAPHNDVSVKDGPHIRSGPLRLWYYNIIWQYNIIIQCVPLATEPGISLIILTLMKLLQRNLNRSTFVVWEMKWNVSVVCFCSAPNCCDTESRNRCGVVISRCAVSLMAYCPCDVLQRTGLTDALYWRSGIFI